MNKNEETALETAKEDIGLLMTKVSNEIDQLTSSELKRVLKTVTHVHMADSFLGGEDVVLKENEQSLIDNIFQLQESVLGSLQLQNEIKEAKNV